MHQHTFFHEAMDGVRHVVGGRALMGLARLQRVFFALAWVFVLWVGMGGHAFAQGTPPSPDANCTVSAANRTAPLQAGYDFTIFNIPAPAPDPTVLSQLLSEGATQAELQERFRMPPFRVRVVCSDGTVGETDMVFPTLNSTVEYTGPIYWRPSTPIPIGLKVTAGQNKLTTGQSTQITTLGVSPTAQTYDLTPRIKGTKYNSTNPLIVDVDSQGVATVRAGFASGSAARVLISAENEGVAGSTLLQVGPRGRLSGTVTRADGVTPVSGARVSVIRNQPRELLGTVTTDASGQFVMEDVSAGAFQVSVSDPATGDMGRGFGQIQTEGETGQVNVALNGQGTLTVKVVNGAGAPVSGADITLTSLSGYNDSRIVKTDAAGQVVLERVMAGPFTVSTRDDSSGLVAAMAGTVAVNGQLEVVLKLQPVGAISGVVYGAGGSAVQAGVQVRLVSATRGIMTQAVTQEDGRFEFDLLPLSDGPYMLDAMQDGRLRARVPNLMLLSANQSLVQDIVFGPAGMVTGVVTRSDGSVAQAVKVTVQSLIGERFTFSTQTDGAGRYAVDGVPVGAFSINASAGNGEVANAGGNIEADGNIQTLNLQLAANGIVGSVFGRDGSTVVGAGVNVTLSPGAKQTQTNAQGQYGFVVGQPGTYTVEVSDGAGNRGRTRIVLTSINPSDPKIVNVAFLGRGTVEGVVKDANGALQAGVDVRFTSSSVFGGTRLTKTDAQGRYQLAGEFVGDFSVYAHSAITSLAGVANGRIAGDGEVVKTDVVLAATGTVHGKVVASDGATAVPLATVVLNVNGHKALQATADAQGNFSFEGVPLGDITLDATNALTGDRGLAFSRLSAINETRSVNVRLLGQGSVRVQALNSAGQAVEGAVVRLTSQSAFGGTEEVRTGADGSAVFAKVFNGDFAVTAEKGTGLNRLSASAKGTMVQGASQTVSLTMSTVPVGSLSGTVRKGLQGAPQAGVEVRLQNTATGSVRSTLSDAQGRYAFEQVEVGPSYRLIARVNNRVRAQIEGAGPTEADEQKVLDVALLGAGTVSGLVSDVNGNPAAGIQMSLSVADSVYGGNWSATTQADGTYRFADVPAARFTLRARSANGAQQAQTDGAVRFDLDDVVVNLALISSAVTMPQTLYDANGMTFNVQGDGSIASGTRGVFNGAGGGDQRGSRLELVVNGVAVPFTNGDGSVGSLTQANQLLEMDEVNPATGLNVTRRVYVPKTGYFARYLEVLENRTANPVTVGLRVVTHYDAGSVGARVVGTSSNDNVLDVSSPDGRDRWLVVDDNVDGDPFEIESHPAVAQVFDGPQAPTAVAEAGVQALASAAKVVWAWQEITLQPGETQSFMHFVSQQLSRSAARQAAERLSQLPPEALEGLSAMELSTVRNFQMPVGGLSALESLPSVVGSEVKGTVFAGDGSTVVAGSSVRLVSQHPLYGRTFRARTDAQGAYQIKSGTNLGQGSVGLLQDRYVVDAVHPLTKASSSPVQGDFEAGQTSSTADIVFNGTGILRGNVKRHTGAAVTSGTVYIPYSGTNCNLGIQNVLCVPIGMDGSYQFTGLEPLDALVHAVQNHPQGGDRALIGQSLGAAVVSAGNTTLVDVQMEPTGEITGLVSSATGEPVVGASVKMDGSSVSGDYRRHTQTDTAGRYRLTDVATGEHRLLFEKDSLKAEGTTQVETDVSAVVNAQLSATVPLTITVTYARGLPAEGARVSVRGQGDSASYAHRLETNAAGQVSVIVPVNTALGYTIEHPENDRLTTEGSATFAPGSPAVLDVALPLAATIEGMLWRPDGSTPVPSHHIRIERVGSSSTAGLPYIGWLGYGATTNSAGFYRIESVPQGDFRLEAVDANNFWMAEAFVSVGADGEVITRHLTFGDNRIQLPTTLWDANAFDYTVSETGALSYLGVSAVLRSGVKLSVGGVAFVGSQSASREASGRQLSIAQADLLAGLRVTRKVYVPQGAFFARYLDVLENPSDAPITTRVELKTSFNYSYTRLLGTSSGDADLQPASEAGQGDAWAIFRESAGNEVGWVWSGTSANDLSRPSGLAWSKPDMATSWSSITVPARGRVTLMHFVAPQFSQAGANAAVERLGQLPPEALAELTEADRASILNFVMPADGQSRLAALPSLAGSVSGTVYEGDGKTTVPDTSVVVRSQHPLFGRSYCSGTLVTGANGTYSVAGGRGVGDAAVPVDSPVDVWVVRSVDRCPGTGHPVTHMEGPSVTASFPQGTSALTQDLLFASGILTGTVVGPADWGVGSGSVQARVSGRTVSVSIRSDGTYVLPGMPAGQTTLSATASHPQGTDPTGSREATVTVGQTTVADINLEASGSVQGVVLTANGEAAVGSTVRLEKSGFTRSTSADSLGQFTLSAVPVGQYTLTAVDRNNNAKVTAVVDVQQNQVTNRNLTLLGSGVVNVQVRTVDGAPAASVDVYLQAAAVSTSFAVAGRTNASGALSIPVPVGAYSIRVRRSDDARPNGTDYAWRTHTGVMQTASEVQSVALRLPALASVQLTVVDGAVAGEPPIADASVTLFDGRCPTGCNVGSTSSSGTVLINQVLEGAYRLSVSSSYSKGYVSGEVAPNADGSTISHTMRLGELAHRGVLTFLSERQLLLLPVREGDSLEVVVRGEAPAYVRANVFDDAAQLLASGVGRESGGWRELNDLSAIPVTRTGVLTLQVSPYYLNDSYRLGNYRLSLFVNGAPVAVQPFSGGRVTGRLTRVDGTTPVANAQVRLNTPDEPGLTAEVTTDAQGVYRFDNVPLGSYLLTHQHDESTQASSSGELVDKDVVATTNLTLPAIPGRITGRVLLASGEPAVGVDVFASSNGVNLPEPNASQRTDSDGHFTFEQVPIEAPVVLKAQMDEGLLRSEAEKTFLLSEGQVVDTELQLQASQGGRLKIVVRGSDGETVPGECLYEVQIANGPSEELQGACALQEVTVPVGAFSVRLLVGSHIHVGFEGVSADFAAASGQVLDWSPVLSRVSGLVSYADGRAASKATLDWWPDSGGRYYDYYYSHGHFDFDRWKRADELGRYAVYGLPPGQGSLTADEDSSAADYGGLSAEAPISPPVGQDALLVNLAFPPTGKVVGTVLGADGQPLPWASVYVRGAGLGYLPSRETGEDGSFVFPTVKLGSLVVSAFDGESGNVASTSATLSSAGQQVSVALQMKPLTRLTGVVRRPDGTPADDASVTVTMADRTGAMSDVYLTTRTNSAGEFAVEGVPRGQVKVRITKSTLSAEVLGDTDIAGELSLEVLLK